MDRLQLENLAFDQVRDDARNELDDLALAQSRERGTRPPEKEVAGQHGQFVPERGRCRRSPSPQRRLVDHVVVEKRRDMDHLDYLRKAYLRREQGERRGDSRDGRHGWERRGRWRLVWRVWWPEREGRLERRGVVRHARIPVVEHVGTR